MEKRLKNIQTFEQHSSELNISGVSDSNLIFNLNENYIVIKLKEDSQISFYVFDKDNLPNLENIEKYNNPSVYNLGNPYLDKKRIAKANIYNHKSLHDLGYSMIRNKEHTLDLNKIVVHLNNIKVDKKYRGKDIGKELLKFIMKNLKTNVIYLQPDSEKSYNYWIHIGCKDTGYNYLDYEDTPLLKYRSIN